MALVGADCRLVLCAECMFQRAVARGVALTLADLQPVCSTSFLVQYRHRARGTIYSAAARASR